MGRIIGVLLLFGGIGGYLYSWIKVQKSTQRRIEELQVFLQKSIFTMESESTKIIQLFRDYSCEDSVITDTLQEIAYRLNQNRYPKGQSVWEEVLEEKKQSWNIDGETLEIVKNAGNGFFGRNRSENICFLQKSLKELEIQSKKKKEKDTKERKVWIPVGMLGGIMLTIIFI